MNFYWLKIASLIFFLTFTFGFSGHSQNYEVVVYSGSSAGFTAAIEAAKSGRKVALIEPTGHIGGMLVEGLGGSDIDNHGEFQNSVAVSGITLEFYRKIAMAYDRLPYWEKVVKEGIKDPEVWRFESSVAEQVILDWLADYPDISIHLGERLSEEGSAIKKTGTNITAIKMENGKWINGRVFIDASIEGDLLAAAGVSYTVGRESNATYGETLNGIRDENTYRQFEVQVNPYINPDDPNSGLISTIQDEALGTPGEGDNRLQAYCFRMCLTQEEENQIPFPKPVNYDNSKYEIYLRYLRAGGKLYVPTKKLPKGKTDLGAWHDLSHNLYGMNRGYPEGSYSERDSIFRIHKDFTMGLFFFLANDPEVGRLDPSLQKRWASWGLARDEFTDNGGWPRQFYVRDGRRMVSDHVITEHHLRKENSVDVEDPVALAFWPPDVHHVRRIVRGGYAYNEGFVFGGDFWKPLPISYRALVPKDSECTNLITPTCLSSSHIAYGAIRLEWTFMTLGQVSAIVANAFLSEKGNIQEVPYQRIRDLIKNAGIISELP